MSSLTRDKPLLSRPKNWETDTPRDEFAIDCTRNKEVVPGASERVSELVRDSVSPSTRRAYSSDIARFKAWGGRLRATDVMIASYLSDHAKSHSVTSLARWLSSLSKAHKVIHAPDPTGSELARTVIRGIRRRHGRPAKQAKPLTRELLFDVLDAIGGGTKDARDRALLLFGFAGGFRRSELVGLDVTDLERVDEEIVVKIQRSKTDQTGQGRKIGIPFARGRHCPVKAIRTWIEVAGLVEKSLLRPVDRHGNITAMRLSGEAVSLTVKDRLCRANIDPRGFSGHSLRAGFVTSAAQAGIASWKIRQQTGHASDAMLSRYIRDTEMFVNNPAGAML